MNNPRTRRVMVKVYLLPDVAEQIGNVMGAYGLSQSAAVSMLAMKGLNALHAENARANRKKPKS